MDLVNDAPSIRPHIEYPPVVAAGRIIRVADGNVGAIAIVEPMLGKIAYRRKEAKAEASIDILKRVLLQSDEELSIIMGDQGHIRGYRADIVRDGSAVRPAIECPSRRRRGIEIGNGNIVHRANPPPQR